MKEYLEYLKKVKRNEKFTIASRIGFMGALSIRLANEAILTNVLGVLFTIVSLETISDVKEETVTHNKTLLQEKIEDLKAIKNTLEDIKNQTEVQSKEEEKPFELRLR